MDRTIKFRAWDTEKKGWKGLWIFRGGHSGQYDVSNTEIDILDLTNRWGSHVVLMQFTGLYDCEGKEVYMGDIIEGTFQLRKQDPVEFISPVDFSVLWGATVEGDDVYSLGRCRNIKLIGNIYEHPHLLNNESNT